MIKFCILPNGLEGMTPNEQFIFKQQAAGQYPEPAWLCPTCGNRTCGCQRMADKREYDRVMIAKYGSDW